MNFMTGFRDKIHKLFDKKSEPNGDDCEDHSLTVDNGINELCHEFEDCVDFRDNDIEVNANGLNASDDDSSGSSDDNHFFMANQSSRYPRFYTSTVNYYQRWRMRYNLFVVSDTLITVSGRVPERPLSASDSVADMSADQLVLHIGEIHLYFDIVPKYCQPVYVNSSFYPNKSAINQMPDIVLNDEVMARITRIVNSIRYSKDIFQFKFPLSEDLFHRRNQMFDKFFERQMEFIEESVKVFRKSEQKKRKFHNWNQKQHKRNERNERQEVRDYFAYDYDNKHKISDNDYHCDYSGNTNAISGVNTFAATSQTPHRHHRTRHCETKAKADTKAKGADRWHRFTDSNRKCDTNPNYYY
ncbi:unnamed protein product [Medioppia subpectinata]|uniref:Uncharacterized protein n=1 Tax=Medioppia subpectinata TaxID=1979941 RepID=A0A7R9KZJ2_9ACAR|nr:unnamed protein product [Medioppia subpectinata]CAG2111468.1 unnamed protein product [Medioppia subpectinata]